MELTVIGDAVNTASRVESLNKKYGTDILLTESTYLKIRDDFECVLLDEVEIRGKAEKVKLFKGLNFFV